MSGYITYTNAIKKKAFDPRGLLLEFDDFLHQRKVRFSAVVIGSGALAILGFTKKHTVDIDILDPKIPDTILDLAEEFRLEKEKQGVYLIKNWINNGPKALLSNLPKNWITRTQPFFSGKSLTFVTLGRADLLKDKLWGFCDLREQDKAVILHLKPSRNELLKTAEWVKCQEAHPSWPTHVDSKVQELLKGLSYED